MKFVEALLAGGVVLVALSTAPTVSAQEGVHPPAPSINVTERVAVAFRMGDFDELERLYASFGKAGVRSQATGTPRVEHFWKGIAKISNYNLKVSDEYFEQLDLLTRKWALDHPQSVLAKMLSARVLISRAWFHRGGGFSNTVPAAAWFKFRDFHAKAVDQLQLAEGLAGSDSSWNDLMLEIGRASDWDRSRLLSIFEAGIKKNPDHDQLYFSMLTALMPKWGGDLPSVEQYIKQVVARTSATRGNEMYARLYAALSYGEVEQGLFAATRVSWITMKAGFEDRLKRYPHTDHRNMYAYFACMANDLPSLREQLEFMGDKFEPVFWGSNPQRTFDTCKRVAAQT